MSNNIYSVPIRKKNNFQRLKGLYVEGGGAEFSKENIKDTLDFYDYTELSASPSETPASSYCTTFRPSPTLLLLLLSHFSRVRLYAAHQASPSLGFSRQEHWSGLPFPSPMHESEKSK